MRKHRGRGGTPIVEWIAAAIGLLLVVATIAILVRAAIRGETPPDVVVETSAIEASAAGFRVELRARNRGRAAAATVEIVGTLSRGDAIIETRAVTLDYLPGESEARGGIFFEHDPRASTLELRAVGYASP